MNQTDKLVLALPKGRVLKQFSDLVKDSKFALIEKPESSRKLLINTQSAGLQALIIRGWDVPTFVASGAAHLGVVGKDILIERNSQEFIELLDLQIGLCRISLSGENKDILDRSRLKVATKYPRVAKDYLSSLGIQPEIVYLHGSQEIAPSLDLADVIIDLVETGKTLEDNSLIEINIIRRISTRLIANKAALKTRGAFIEEFQSVILKALRN